MRPTLLVARNFRTYPELELQLPDGLVAIVGELRGVADGADSNGAGKSSILEAIDITLFGRRSLAPFLTRGLADAELLLELEFEHAGSVYRVRRTYVARGRGKPSCDFEELADGAWVPLTCSSMKETDQLICRTIGLTRDTYRNSSYLRQGDGSFADPSRDPRERRELLASAVFGHDPIWPQLLERARAEKRLLEASVEQIDGRAQAAREIVDEKRVVAGRRDEVVDVETEVADQVADLEREHADLSEQYQAAREKMALLQAAEMQATAARYELARLVAADARATEAADQILLAHEQLAKLPPAVDVADLVQQERDLVAAVDEHGRLVHARALAETAADAKMRERVELNQRSHTELARAEQLRASAEQLRGSDEHATCDRCGQQLEHAARLHAIGNMLEEADTHQRDGERLRDAAAALEIPVVPPAPAGEPPTVELTAVRVQLEAIRDAQQQRARLEERVVQLQPTVTGRPTPEQLNAAHAAVTEREQELAALAPVDIDQIARQGTRVKERLQTARGQLEQQRALKARLDERLAQIAQAERQLADAARERARLQETLAVVAQLERAYAPSGIPTLILENTALPSIETEANRILDLLGCPYQLELRTQAEKKDGTGLKEILDVVVIDQQGDEAAFEECTSGGEKTRIGLALRIALARLLLHRRGAESRILCLDEPSYLDEAGMRALLGVLSELQTDFDTILLVSHVAELRDSFDVTLEVVRDGATSQVRGVGSPEPVAA